MKDKDWPFFEYNDSFSDKGKMLLNQLGSLFIHAQIKDHFPYAIRCNYGTVILPSILGAKYRLTENSMPWCDHLENLDQVKALIKKGIPDPNAGLGRACFETAEYYLKVLSKYPKLKSVVTIYHPDFQGPFDAAHLIWGHEMLYAMFDHPEIVHGLLSVITETYISWMKKWKEFVRDDSAFTAHWDYIVKGGIMIRDDSVVMISPDQYEEFVKPYDQKLLSVFGGCIHFCGKGDAFIDSMCKTKNLSGINCSQPELNDFGLLLRSARKNRIVLVGLKENAVPRDDARGIIIQKDLSKL